MIIKYWIRLLWLPITCEKSAKKQRVRKKAIDLTATHIHEALVCVWIRSCEEGEKNIFLISCKHTKMEKHMVTTSSLICFY